MDQEFIKFFGLYFFLAGLAVSMGSLAVIETHGFLGRKSPYWSEATIRTHKVTKPLIWAGFATALAGASLFYSQTGFDRLVAIQAAILLPLVLNGIFLTFWVSPRLLEREREGRASELLPAGWQRMITASFIVSILSWWGELFLLVWYLILRLR